MESSTPEGEAKLRSLRYGSGGWYDRKVPCGPASTAPTPLPGRSPPQSDLCDRSSLLASYQEGVRAIAPDTFSMKFSFTHGSKFVVE